MWTKEAITALSAKTKTVKICGDDVEIRKLKAYEVLSDESSGESASFRLASASLVNPVLSVDDVKALPGDVFNELIREINILNGIGNSEEAKKN